jgi:hypothetical protein
MTSLRGFEARAKRCRIEADSEGSGFLATYPITLREGREIISQM